MKQYLLRAHCAEDIKGITKEKNQYSILT
jgi:hypothetical protein